MLKLDEIRSVKLTDDEVFMIGLYSCLFLGSGVPSLGPQWASRLTNMNPYMKGYLGQWACFKTYANLSLSEYLKSLPTYKGDLGDGKTEDGVFDIKTSTWKYGPERLLDKSYYRGSVRDDQLTKEKGIVNYVFVTLDPETFTCRLMGWIPRQDFAGRSTGHKKGELVPENNFTFPDDAHDIQYSELYPISYLFSKGILCL